MTNLTDLSKKIYQTAADKGFWDNGKNIGEALMLVVTELAEGVEVHRKTGEIPILNDEEKQRIEHLSNEDFEKEFKTKVKDSFGDEMADAIIRILDLCGGYNIDIYWHIKMKMRFNATRERLHGKTY